jgi:hypothetical protein
MPSPKDKELLSVRAAVRDLYEYAKRHPTDTALDNVTRAVKFRVRTDEDLKRALNKQFDAADKFRRAIAEAEARGGRRNNRGICQHALFGTDKCAHHTVADFGPALLRRNDDR